MGQKPGCVLYTGVHYTWQNMVVSSLGVFYHNHQFYWNFWVAQSRPVTGTLNVILKYSLSQVDSPEALRWGLRCAWDILLGINICQRRGRKQDWAYRKLDIAVQAPQSLANLVESSSGRVASQGCPAPGWILYSIIT